MREDMAKVLVTRPRFGPRLRLKRRKRHQNPWRDPDATLRREPMSRGQGTKLLNENLAPLERYLHSQVGRPWDAVYSEICARLRPTNAVQQHVRDHLGDFVLVNTRVEDGVVVGTREGGGAAIDVKGPGWGPRLYVDPRSGLLRERRRKRARRRSEAPDPDVRWDGPRRQLRRVEGVWYAFRLEPVPEDAGQRARVRDRLLGRTLEELLRTPRADDPLERAYGRRGVYAAEKRQLSKRELRRLAGLPRGRKRIPRRGW